MNDIVRIQPSPRMSQGVVYGGLLFTAGHVDNDGEGRDVAEQTQRILARLDDLLAQAGSSRSRILSASIWLAEISGFDAMNRVWDAWIDPQNPPARATVEAKLAGAKYRVEIALIAAMDWRGDRSK
jgi:enamine deaminase RidA (YjgF/YER057c/UK114 family)